jgi:hypothetical protein
MEKRISYSVTFKRDDEVIFQTGGFLETTQGEPHDTAAIFYSALEPFVAAKNAGKLPKDAVKICNMIMITDPDGAVRSFSEDQIEGILDQDAELRKIKVTAETAIVVSVEGGISGGDMREPVEATVSEMTPEDRSRVEFIIDLVQSRKPKFTYDQDGWVGDFGHYVRIGHKQQTRWEKELIFCGGFRQTPLEVEELRTILERHKDRK